LQMCKKRCHERGGIITLLWTVVLF
jgi:hypothetical protein